MTSNIKLNNLVYRLDGIFSNTIVWIILIIFLAPYIYLILGSFKTQGDIQAYPPKIISKFTFENYIKVFTDINIIFYLKNSFIVAGLTTILSLIIALPAAYSFARFNFLGKEWLAYVFIAILMAPIIA